jgi:transcription elongation factor GreB
MVCCGAGDDNFARVVCRQAWRLASAGAISYHARFDTNRNVQVNKAFVKDSDGGGDDGDEELAPALRLPPGSKNYMTRRGYEALRAELEQLVRVERPEAGRDRGLGRGQW